MKFRLVTPEGNIPMQITTIKEMEKFFNEAIADKIEKDKLEDLKALKVYPQDIVIIAKEGDYLAGVLKVAFNVFVGEE